MRVLIAGAGALGLAIGSALHAARHRFDFLLRPGRAGDQGRALIQHGFTRSGLFGDVHVPGGSFGVFDHADALADEPFDYVLVCTKTTANPDLTAALGALWPALTPEPQLVVCQNGWGNAEGFAAFIAREHVHNARVITGFRRPDPLHVEVTVHADAIALGNRFGAPTDILRPLAEALDAGGLPTKISTSIARDLWAKVLYNCLLNPLGALVGVPYGVLGEREATRNLMACLAGEIFDVMEASGHETHWRSAAEYLAVFYDELLPATADHESSMLQDLRAARRTEIGALCGAVSHLGARHGVPTPTNQALCELIRAAEDRARASDP